LVGGVTPFLHSVETGRFRIAFTTVSEEHGLKDSAFASPAG
jgi:hypothetical protein